MLKVAGSKAWQARPQMEHIGVVGRIALPICPAPTDSSPRIETINIHVSPTMPNRKFIEILRRHEGDCIHYLGISIVRGANADQ